MVQAEVKPIYVLFGSDVFLLDETRKSIVAQVIGESDPQTSVTPFDASAELADVLDELRTMPFLAPRRAVILSDADAFVSAYRESIEKYLESPSSCSTLILTVASWPKNTRLYKRVATIGKSVDCNSPDERKLISWVHKSAAKRDKKIAPDAAELLLAWRGADMAAIDSELEKLSLYAADRETITTEDVSTLVTATAGPAAFALTNAITSGNIRSALKALAGAITRRGEEFKMLGQIAWHLRKALQVQQQVQAGASPGQACKDARVFYQQREFLEMLRRRPIDVLQNDFRRLLAADLAMKSGTNATAALQQLVVGLCS